MQTRTVLVVDDEKLVRWSIRQKLEAAGYEVVEAENGIEAMRLFQKTVPDLVTLDVRLPDESGLKLLLEMKKLASGVPIMMITAYGAIDDAVKALQIGAYDYLEKPVNFEKLLHSIENALEFSALRTEVERTKKVEREAGTIDRIIGESKAIREVKGLLEKVAGSEARIILIQGESGTGKDLVAKALHYHSPRSRQPFLVLNCAAIPEQLLETELFGHERGAFTDAKTQKKGLFELADGGTIFFDEIGEIPLNLQSKLLRVLEDQTFRRIGGTKDIRVDVRVVCATNQDLEDMVRKGGFREDLFYRLSVIPILLPPLRERREDVKLLVDYFVQDYNLRFRKAIRGLTPEASRIMDKYHWPGNIRELKNVIERAMILEDDGLIGVDLLPLRISEPSTRSASDGKGFVLPAQGVDLYQMEKGLIRQALAASHHNQTKAARMLSISRDTLRYKIKKYKLNRAETAAGSED